MFFDMSPVLENIAMP